MVEFNVIPVYISAKPFDAKGVLAGDPADGVKVEALNTATLIVPEYIEAITLSPPELPTVSILNPDNCCPSV